MISEYHSTNDANSYIDSLIGTCGTTNVILHLWYLLSAHIQNNQGSSIYPLLSRVMRKILE